MEKWNAENILWGLLVLGALYFLVKYAKNKRSAKGKDPENDTQANRVRTPTGLSEELCARKTQAYERLLLLVQRSEFSALIFRVLEPQMSVSDLQSELTRTLRDEWEHNTVQQLYVSDAVWMAVEEYLQAQRLQIHRKASECDSLEPAQSLAALLLTDNGLEQEMIKKAKQLIKQEMRVWMEY